MEQLAGVLERHLRPSIDEALADTRAVLVVGARQTGKTTLVRALQPHRPGSTYVTLDDLTALEVHGGQEVDLVLEDPRGRVVGIEVKASATVTASDLAGLRALAEIAGKAFVQGIVLHLGASQVSFGPGLTACPLEVLWS